MKYIMSKTITSPIVTMYEILDNLWLSNDIITSDISKLLRNKITHIEYITR